MVISAPFGDLEMIGEDLANAVGNLEKAIHQLYLYHSANPRFRGTEETVEDFQLLLTAVAAKFKTETAGSAVTTATHAVVTPKETPPLDDNQLILFLDFDGVCWVDPMNKTHEKLIRLKSDPKIDALIKEHSSLLTTQYDFRVDDQGVHEFLKAACWDSFHMQRIRLLCNEFNARIVVSSSWRNERSVKQLKNLLDLWGLGSYYIGKTADKNFTHCRTNCVRGWIAKNPKIRKFLILDDQYEQNMKRDFPNHYVKCDPLKGFDEETYLKARKVAQNQTLSETSANEIKPPKVTIPAILSLRPGVPYK